MRVSKFRILFDSFFDTFFDENLVLERSWAVLGWSWAILGGLGAVLGRSWAILGRSWAVLGRSWGDLGRSWGGPGGSWGAPEASWRPKRVPKGSQNRPKIDQKSIPKSIQKSSRIRDGQNRSGATPADVSEGSEAQRTLDPATP